MEDKELKLDEVESSLTLVGAEEGGVQGEGSGEELSLLSGTHERRSQISVVITDGPVCMCERGAWVRVRGGYWCAYMYARRLS
jgi:hypothetical protein